MDGIVGGGGMLGVGAETDVGAICGVNSLGVCARGCCSIGAYDIGGGACAG